MRIVFSALMVAAVGGGLAAADVITLQDGSRVVGTVERLADGKLKIITQFAGTLEVDASQVTSIDTDGRFNVGMTTGDRLVGPIDWSGELNKGTVQSELGGVPFGFDKVSAIWPEGEKSPEELAMEAEIEKVRKENEAKWEFLAEAGLLYQDGNKEIFTVSAGLQAIRTSAQDQFKVYARGQYAENNKVRSASEVIGGLYYEYRFFKPDETRGWYVYGRTEYEYDEFENLNLRATLALGPGYYWIRKKTHEFKTRAGIAYLHEAFFDDTTRDDGQLDIGLDYRIDITPHLTFTHTTNYYPTFEEISDYRLESDTAFVFPIAGTDKWKIKLGARYEFDDKPRPGVERLDQTYYANLVFNLK